MLVTTYVFSQCEGTDTPCPISASTPSNLGTVTTGAFCSFSSCANGHGDGAGTTSGQTYSTTYGGTGICNVGDATGNDVWFRFTMPASTDKVNMDIDHSACGSQTGRIMIYGPNPNCAAYSGSAFYCVTWTGVGLSDVITGLSGGATYHVRVLFEGTTCTFDLCFYKAVSTLPIELLSFNAYPISEKEIRVNWVTASETDNDYFTIERSANGINFSSVGTVKGAGNSSSQKKYSWIDSDPVTGTSYYRLKQTDFDGQFEIFNPVSVNFEPNHVEWLFVYPNTISNSENLKLELTNLPLGKEVEVHLYDLQGKTVYSRLFPLDANGKGIITSIDIPDNLSSGMYALSVICGNGIGMQKVFIH